MTYSLKVLDHYENPRNVGSLDKNDPSVGTGLVGAPACGDVMKLQIRAESRLTAVECVQCGLRTSVDVAPEKSPCCSAEFRAIHEEVITDAKFKTFGCGSAIASSSLVTEWVKGRTLDDAGTITNQQIAGELSLPPVKIHCSVLAEDAVKAAIADFRQKRQAAATVVPPPERIPEDSGEC